MLRIWVRCKELSDLSLDSSTPPHRCEQVASTSDEKLNQPLLKTLAPLPGAAPGAPERLGVNFDDDLVRLLRETKYFLLLKFEVWCLSGGRGGRKLP